MPEPPADDLPAPDAVPDPDLTPPLEIDPPVENPTDEDLPAPEVPDLPDEPLGQADDTDASAEEGMTAPSGVAESGPARQPGRAARTDETCTVAVDLRGVPGTLQRVAVTYVLDEDGRQLWPDPEAVRDIPTEAFENGRLHRYVRATQDLSRFPNLTVVQGAALARPRNAPRATYQSDVILDRAAAERFERAERGCRLLYILP